MSLAANVKAWAAALKQNTLALYLASRHPDVPVSTKLLAILIVAYALSPIDLIPDVIPVLGYLDDLLLLPAALWLIIRLIPDEIWQDCLQDAADRTRTMPTSWAAGAIIMTLWLFLAVLFCVWAWPLVKNFG